MKIGICYCQKNNKDRWKLFAKDLERLLKCKIELVFFEDEKSQSEILHKEDFDAVYVPFPIYVYELYKKRNFLPFARFKDPPTNPFVLISYQSSETLKKRKLIKIGILNHPAIPGLLLFATLHTNLPLSNLGMISFNSYDEIIKALKAREIDAGIVPEKFFQEKASSGSLFILSVIPTTHYFMLPENGKNTEKFLKASKNLENFEILPSWTMDSILSYYLFCESFSLLLENFANYKNILTLPHFGILIYQNHFVYANEYVCNLLGYSLEEFKKLKLEDIIYGKDKEIIKEPIKKSLESDFFEKTCKKLILKTKSGQKCYVLACFATILYHGKYAILIGLLDLTEEERFKALYKVLKEINQILISCESEDEIYNAILPVLAKELQLKGAWIGKVDEDKGIVEFKIGYPAMAKQALESIGFTKNGIVDLKNTKFLCIVNAIKNKKVFIVPEIQEFPYPKELKNYAKRDNVHSICNIPIVKEGKVVSLISMATEESKFFTEKFKELLTELQKDIAFALKKIELLQEKYIIAKFIERINELMIIADKTGEIEYINPYARKLLGIEKGENILNVFPEIREKLNKMEKIKETEDHEVVVYNKKNKKIPLEICILRLSFSDRAEKILLCGRDLYKDIIFEEEKKKLKEYDLLTGILNHYGFIDQLKDLVDLFKRKGILILIDIDKFGMINHFYGIEAGEKCLKDLAERLKNFVKNNGIVGRVAANTFAIFLVDTDKEKIPSYLKELKTLISKPFIFKNISIKPDFHGSALYYPDDASNSKELYEKALLLLKQVKEKEIKDIEIYNPSIEKSIQKVFYTEQLIKSALENHQFVFYYQPYFDSNSLEVAGFEALIRIKRDNKIIPPSEFIEFLENSSYLKDVESFLIYKNIEILKKWQIPISVNLSFTGIESLHILKIFKEWESILKNLPTYFILEITERKLAHDLEQTRKILSVLKAYNAKIALDDFGTGYSSLNYLRDLPIDIVKIDRSFVKLMLKDKRTYSIVESLINLAKKLGLKTIGEGVETEEEMKALQNLGCDFLQGFLFSPPLPPEEAEKLINK